MKILRALLATCLLAITLVATTSTPASAAGPWLCNDYSIGRVCIQRYDIARLLLNGRHAAIVSFSASRWATTAKLAEKRAMQELAKLDQGAC